MSLSVVLRLALAIGLMWLSDATVNCAFAQGEPIISVVSLQVQPGAQGNQMVLTPKGYLVPLPGSGVQGNTVEIYMGDKGGFWYIDRTRQPVDITAYVQQVRAQTAQAESVAMPQYAPYPADSYDTSQSSQPSNSGSSSGSSSTGASAGATAAAAGAGAMLGSSMANAAYYHNVPYGTQMYYGQNGRPFYNDDRGRNVFVDDDGDVKWNNVAATKQVQKNRQEQKVNQLSAYQEQRGGAQSAAPQAAPERQAPEGFNRQRSDQQGSQRFQQQEQWYHQQTQDRNRAQTWQQQSAGENPFVRSENNADARQRDGSRAASERSQKTRPSARASRGGGGRSRGGGGGRGRR